MTLGEKNHNPLNIRYSPMNKWRGQKEPNKGFCTFINDRFGYRAALILLRNYVRKGLSTPAQIVSTWAPASENNVEKYLEFLIFRGIPAHVEITTMEQLCFLCSNMALFESCMVVSSSILFDIAILYHINL